MTDDMTSFELQQEVDKILNRANTLADASEHLDTPEHTETETLASNSSFPASNTPILTESNANKKTPIKFKVRKVSGQESNNTQKNSHNKSKHLKSTQLQYDQCVNRIDKINKEVNFLKRLLPPYNVDIDYHTRVKIDKAIDKLNMKNDELSKKKYQLGITLSRLWRDFDDSEIWVRSVSN